MSVHTGTPPGLNGTQSHLLHELAGGHLPAGAAGFAPPQVGILSFGYVAVCVLLCLVIRTAIWAEHRRAALRSGGANQRRARSASAWATVAHAAAVAAMVADLVWVIRVAPNITNWNLILAAGSLFPFLIGIGFAEVAAQLRQANRNDLPLASAESGEQA